jgi:hypothetical protein
MGRKISNDLWNKTRELNKNTTLYGPNSHRLIYEFASETGIMWRKDESRLESTGIKHLGPVKVKRFIRTRSRNKGAADKISTRENIYL